MKDKDYILLQDAYKSLYHGSNNDIIGGFDENKIGSSATAYGWGVYFSEEESYAKTQGKGHNIDMQGKMYYVDIDYNSDEFIKLDYPITEQSTIIKNIVNKFKKQIETGSGRYGFNDNDIGIGLYRYIRESFGYPKEQNGLQNTEWDKYGNKDKNTSMFLVSQGIKGGIFYTSTKEGYVKNYIIYDLSILKNLKRIY